jgi:hypothetical protein
VRHLPHWVATGPRLKDVAGVADNGWEDLRADVAAGVVRGVP